MPIYEYECPKCGLFEVVQKASEKALKKNPECTCADCPKNAKRLISAAAFHLKGSGWYKTDYSGKSSGNTPASSGSGDSSGSGKSDGNGEAAPKKKACGSGCGCH